MLTRPSKRWLDGVSDGPAVLKSPAKAFQRHAEMGGPLRNRSRFSVELEHKIHARVIALLLLCGPSAIVRFIISVVVDTFDRVLRARSRPHVLVKSKEGLAPFFAHRNAAPAVVGPCFASRIKATLLCLSPDGVLGVMRQRGLLSSLARNTTTRWRGAGLQVFRAHDPCSAASAATPIPVCFGRDSDNIAIKDCPSSDGLPWRKQMVAAALKRAESCARPNGRIVGKRSPARRAGFSNLRASHVTSRGRVVRSAVRGQTLIALRYSTPFS